MPNRTDLKIFIASSGELNDERDESLKVIVKLNKLFSYLHMEPVLFELNTASGNNPGLKRIQDGINPLLDESDIVVVMFYSRIGEFTLEEFVRAKTQNKKIFLYLKDGFQPKNSSEGEKYTELLKLKEDVEKESNIRYQKFTTINDFNKILYDDLNTHIIQKYHKEVQALDSYQLESGNIVNNLNLYPIPKPYFVGRDEEIKEFESAVVSGVRFIAVDGPGGIGKTQFVSKCIEKFIPKDRVIWYQCTSASQFDTLISEAGFPEILKGKSKSDSEKFAEFVSQLQNGNYYLFLDNFQETNSNPIFKNFLIFIQDYLRNGCVIVIDRDDIRNIELTPRQIHVKGFDKEKLEYAKALIAHSYKNDVIISDEELEILCEQLRGYPLVIDFAILLLCEGESSSDIITNIVQSGDVEELSERLLNEIFSRPDATTEEREFMKIFSVFTNSVLESELEAVLPEQRYRQASRRLQKKNLLFVHNGNYDIHPLVREFCYKKLTDKRQIHLKVAEHNIQCRKSKLSPILEEQIFYHLGRSEEWKKIERQINEYGRELVLQGQLGLVKEYVDKLHVLGYNNPLFDILKGDIAQIQSRWDEAQDFFDKAKSNETDRIIKTEGIIKFGEIYHRRGFVKMALPFYQEAFAFAEENGFEKEAARALNDIGLVYYFLSNHKEAESFLKQALKIRIDIGDEVGIAATKLNLAHIYSDKNNLSRAMELYNDSLFISNQYSHDENAALAYVGIGRILIKQNKLKEALIKINKSLFLCQKVNSKTDIARAKDFIAEIYQIEGKLDEALKLEKESHDIFQEIGDIAGIAFSLRNLGFLYSTNKLKNYKLAIQCLLKSIALSKEIGSEAIFRSAMETLLKLKKFVEDFDNIVQDSFSQSLLSEKQFIPISEILKKPIQKDRLELRRNDPCSCGSGKKYKACHGKN